ncbi:MAG: MBOAT family protein [Lachnospiraceae bacterium]|nr:MBOAT family protein [Lachnospiraceae bacterium]
MVFSSMIFLWVFLPVVFILTRILPQKTHNILLLIASLLFYAWGEPVYILLMLCSITMNWLFGLWIEKQRTPLPLALNVICNLGLLFYFKYFSLFTETVNAILKREAIAPRDIALPIGISFFTFQAMSYVIDLYRGKYKAEHNFLHVALYISFFPQLIAGPIVRYVDVHEQINHRRITAEKTAEGIRRFLYGLAKKALIANILAESADAIYALPMEQMTGLLAWAGAILYTFQIYYDFSGYSDMAIGLGKMFGFDFLENFNYPYLSTTAGEFWRRWHISLGAWFKEYLYIPLGGNRKGTARTYVNLMIVFFVTGLWHGASWNFVIWGVYYGVLVVLERLFYGKWMTKHPVVGHIYMPLVFVFGWAIFRVDTGMTTLAEVVKRMLAPWHYTAGGVDLSTLISNRAWLMLLAGIIGCGILQWNLGERLGWKKRWKHSVPEFIFCILIFAASLVTLASGTYNPFIYFRF